MKLPPELISDQPYRRETIAATIASFVPSSDPKLVLTFCQRLVNCWISSSVPIVAYSIGLTLTVLGTEPPWSTGLDVCTIRAMADEVKENEGKKRAPGPAVAFAPPPVQHAIGPEKISLTVLRKTTGDLIVSQHSAERWFSSERAAVEALARIMTTFTEIEQVENGQGLTGPRTRLAHDMARRIERYDSEVEFETAEADVDGGPGA